MRRKFATTLAAVVLTVGISACGSGDDGGNDDEGLSGRDKEVAEALAAVMGRDLTTENGRIASECTATAIVERLGGDGVVEGGLLTEDLDVPRQPHDHYSLEVAEAIGDAFVECWDVDAQVEDVRRAAPGVSEQGLQEFEDCMRAIPDSIIRDTYVNASIEDGDPAKAAALGEAIGACQQKLV